MSSSLETPSPHFSIPRKEMHARTDPHPGPFPRTERTNERPTCLRVRVGHAPTPLLCPPSVWSHLFFVRHQTHQTPRLPRSHLVWSRLLILDSLISHHQRSLGIPKAASVVSEPCTGLRTRDSGLISCQISPRPSNGHEAPRQPGNDPGTSEVPSSHNCLSS